MRELCQTYEQLQHVMRQNDIASSAAEETTPTELTQITFQKMTQVRHMLQQMCGTKRAQDMLQEIEQSVIEMYVKNVYVIHLSLVLFSIIIC